MKLLIDNQYVKLTEIDKNYLLKLKQIFSFKLKKARYLKITYDISVIKHSRFRTGLLPMILEQIIDDGVEYELVDNRSNKFDYKIITRNVGKDVLADRQFDCLNAMYPSLLDLKWYRGIIDAAPNFGKTHVMASTLIRHKDLNILWIVHRKTIFNQMVDFCASLSLEFNILGEYRGKRFENFGGITLAMNVTAIFKRKSNDLEFLEYLDSLHIFIADEAHHVKKETAELADSCNAYAKWFFSGTALTNEFESDNVAIGLSSIPIFTCTHDELMSQGRSLRPYVTIHKVEDIKTGIIVDWRGEQDYLNYCVARVEKIIEIVKSNKGKKIFIFTTKAEAGRFIYERILDSDIIVDFTYSKDPFTQSKIEEFNAGKIDVIIGTGTLSTGVNMPKMQILIYASVESAKNTHDQAISRLIRLDGDNTEVEIIEFSHDLIYSQKHLKKRCDFYKRNNFNIIENFGDRF